MTVILNEPSDSKFRCYMLHGMCTPRRVPVSCYNTVHEEVDVILDIDNFSK